MLIVFTLTGPQKQGQNNLNSVADSDQGERPKVTLATMIRDVFVAINEPLSVSKLYCQIQERFPYYKTSRTWKVSYPVILVYSHYTYFDCDCATACRFQLLTTHERMSIPQPTLNFLYIY